MPARRKILVILFVALVIFLSSPPKVFSQIVINEIEPYGEWVELYKTQEGEVSLNGCVIYFHNSTTTTQKKEFNSEDKFLENEFFKKIETNSNIGWLANDGDTVILTCAWGQDIVSYGPGEIVDKPPLNKSIGRYPDGSSNLFILDKATPLEPNLYTQPAYTPTPTSTSFPTPTKTLTPTPTNTPTPKDYSNIFISEVMAYPETGNEWVELYNDNNFEVDLYGSYFDDVVNGGSSPRQIFGTIPAKSYKQFSLNSTAYFNNGGDDVRLLNANQVEKDKFSFETAAKGKSWSKDKNGKWCQLDPTPNAPNPDCPNENQNPTSTPIPNLTPTPKPTFSPTPTPTLKITPTEATKSGEVLGEGEEATVGGFYPFEATEEAKEVKEATPGGKKSSKNKILGGIFIGVGLVALFGAAFSLWYTKIK
jgi:hypothetical protein